MSRAADSARGKAPTQQALGADRTVHGRAEERHRQCQGEEEALREIISATATQVKLPAVLEEALRGTLRLTGLEGGTICLVNSEAQSLELGASVNASPELVADLTGNRIRIGDCLCGHCARECRPLILWDNASGSVFATREATRNEGIRFHAAFPLRGRGQCMGVLCLFARSEKKPNQRSLELVQEACGPIALAIENTLLLQSAQRELAERARTEEKLQRTNRTLRMISRCNQVLVRATEEGRLLREVCRIVVEEGGYRMAWVGFAQADEAKTVRLAAQAGFEEGYLERVDVVWADTERGRGPAGTAIRTGQPCVIQDAIKDPRFAPWRAEALKRGYASVLGCPLLSEGRALGALTIYGTAPDVFSAEEVGLLNGLAENLAFGLAALRTRAQREEAERAVRVRAHLLAESQRIAHIGTWSMPLGAERIAWTEETYRIYGVAPGAFVPTVASLKGLLVAEDRPAMERWIANCTTGRRPGPLEFRIRLGNGDVRTLSGQGDLEYGAGDVPTGIVGTVQDITERKRAEEALQRSEALLKESQSIAHLGSWELDLQTDRLRWSDEVYRIFGLQPQEFGATYGAFLAAVHPEDRAAVQAAYSGSVQRGEEVYEIEHRVVKRDSGEVRTVHEKCCHVKDVTGKIVRSIGMVHDITERKQAERELERHREHLAELVAARTAELQAANRDLEAFSYSVSHDLRAPLRAIEGYAQILARSFGPSLAGPGQKMVEAICRQATFMGQLINDLLAFSRLGRQAMQPVPLDMEVLAREAFEAQLAAAPNPNAKLQVQALPPAYGDRAMIRVVLNNLLSNALKYSRGRKPALIEVGGAAQGAQNVYFIRDNGAGFDMKDAGRLFGVFQRLHSKEEFEGTGVGLALVQRIIQRHDGRVWAEGRVGQGATFSFSLPAPKAGS